MYSASSIGIETLLILMYSASSIGIETLLILMYSASSMFQCYRSTNNRMLN